MDFHNRYLDPSGEWKLKAKVRDNLLNMGVTKVGLHVDYPNKILCYCTPKVFNKVLDYYKSDDFIRL